MTNVLKKPITRALIGLSLVSVVAGCGTLTGATLGGAAGAGMGQAPGPGAPHPAGRGQRAAG